MTKYPTNKELTNDLNVMQAWIKRRAAKSWAAEERLLTKKALVSHKRKDLLEAVNAWGNRGDLSMDEHIIEMAMHSAEDKGWIKRVQAKEKS